MSDSDPKIPTTTPQQRTGARASTLMIWAAVAFFAVLALFMVGNSMRQTASTDNAAPSLTTGSATSTPNSSGTTPPASR